MGEKRDLAGAHPLRLGAQFSEAAVALGGKLRWRSRMRPNSAPASLARVLPAWRARAAANSAVRWSKAHLDSFIAASARYRPHAADRPCYAR